MAAHLQRTVVVAVLFAYLQGPHVSSAIHLVSKPVLAGTALAELSSVEQQAASLERKTLSDTRAELLSFVAHLNATLLETSDISRDLAHLRQALTSRGAAESAGAQMLLTKVKENEDIASQVMDGLDYLTSKSNELGAGTESWLAAETNLGGHQVLLELPVAVKPTAAAESATLPMRVKQPIRRQKMPPSSIAETRGEVAAKTVEAELANMESEFATDLAEQAHRQNEEIKREKARLLEELNKEQSRAVELQRQLDNEAKDNELQYHQELVALRGQRNAAYLAIASGATIFACLTCSLLGASTQRK